MPSQVTGGSQTALNLYQALYAQAPSNPLFIDYKSTINTYGASTFASQLLAGFVNKPSKDLAFSVLTNLGVYSDALRDALTQMFDGYGVASRGQILLNATALLATLEGDVTFGVAAAAFNAKIGNNFLYASNASNLSPGVYGSADPSTYALIASAPTISEGGVPVVVTLTTKNVADGTHIPYVVVGAGSAIGATKAGEFIVYGNTAVAVVAVDKNSSYGDTGWFTFSLAGNKGNTVAVTVIDTTIAAPVVNQTISLSVASEIKIGGTGNDTFLALNSGDLSNGDNVDGGAGSDAIYVVQSLGTSDTAIRPVLTSVESVQFELFETASSETGGHTFSANFDKSSGVNTVIIKNYTFNTAGLGAADTIEIKGVSTSTSLNITDDAGASTGRTNNYTVTYAGVSGATDSASVEISSTSAATVLGNITEAGIETLTISSTGGAGAGYKVVAVDATALTVNASAISGGAVDLNASKLATLNINAADAMTITDAGAASAALRTVNIDSQISGKTVTLSLLSPTATAASSDTFTVNVKGAGNADISIDSDFGAQGASNADAFVVAGASSSGVITVNLSAFATNAPQNLLVTTGTGNDSVTVSTGGLDKYDLVALGNGIKDTLITTATFGSVGANVADVFYADTLTGATLPTISGVEIARINLAGTVASTNTFSVKSAAFASTVEINAGAALDISNKDFTVSNLAAGQAVTLGSNLDLDSAVVTLALVDASGLTDTLVVTTDGKNQTVISVQTASPVQTAAFGGITSAGVETVRLDLASTSAANTAVTAGTLTFSDASLVTLTGSKNTTATVIAKSGATIDATGVNGTLTLSANDNKAYTVKGSATKATEFLLGSYLNNADNITGGSASTDAVYASINGLTATTGALTVTGVENIYLDAVTTASTVSASGITGALNIAVDGVVSLNLTNLRPGIALTLGSNAGSSGGTATAYTGTLTASLADATGPSDSLTINLTGKGTELLSTLIATGIETVTLAASPTVDTQNIDVSGLAATTVNLSGGNTTSAVGISLAGGGVTAGVAGTSKLNASTATLDASGYNGAVTAIAATSTATTFKAQVPSTFTGSVLNDVITLGNAAAFVGVSVGTIDGGDGTDTLTAYVKGSAELASVTNVETFNLILSRTATDYSSNAYSITSAGFNSLSSPWGIQAAATVNITGGLAGTTVTLSGDLGDSGARTLDASTDLGSIVVTFANAGLVQSGSSDAIVIKGGQGLTDVVNVKASGNNSNLDTGEFTMSGVEKLILTSGYDTTNLTGDNTVNLKYATGLSTVGVLSGTQSDTAAFTNAPAGVTFEIGQGASAMSSSVTIGLASSSGSANSLAVKLIKTSGMPTITTDGVETLNLSLADSAEDHSVSLANTNTNAATLNISGVNVSADLTINSLGSAYTTVSATGLKGALTLDNGAIGSALYVLTGGEGGDTIGMKHASSVLDGGLGADTLNISYTGNGGALNVDLSSTVDQVAMFNGLVNTAVQKGFENVNASAYVQNGAVGADITDSGASNVITGTGYADVIRLTNGGSDTVKFAATAAANGADTVVGFKVGATASGGDVIGNLAAGFLNSALDLTIAAAGDSLGIDASAVTKDLRLVNVAQIFTTAASTFGDANVDAVGSTTVDHIILGNAQKLVLVAQTASTATTAYVYFITAGAVAGTSDVVTLVGTLTLDVAGTWISGNFV